MKTPPAPPGEVVSAFFCFPSFFGVHSSLGAASFFVRFRPRCRIPRSPGFLALQHEIVVERSKEGREKLVKIFPPCERARGVVFGGPEVVIFPPAGRLASRRASDPPPGGAGVL